MVGGQSILMVLADPTLTLEKALNEATRNHIVAQMESGEPFTVTFMRERDGGLDLNKEPVVVRYTNKGNFEANLKIAEHLVNEGCPFVLTNTETEQVEEAPNLNETPTELPVKPEKAVSLGDPTEEDYWNVRSSIRNGFLRLGKYKLPDTATIFEELRNTGDTFQATRNFERLLTELARQAYVQGCRETGEKQRHRQERDKQIIANLEQQLRNANSTIHNLRNNLREWKSNIEQTLRHSARTIGVATGGPLLRPATPAPLTRPGEAIIPASTRFKPEGFA